MLKIQRASAGSGKTFTLARNYILNLIAYVNQKGEWRLRNERQIEDALLHILAITFTNKATNEMKQRIVGNLSLLSKASDVNNLSDEFLTNTPYLKEFHEITGASYQKIGEVADLALKSILNNFSFFRISTIDSFFQEILRTFVYEANINESYQLEIDSTFIMDSALDAAIHELDTHPSDMGTAAFWLRTVINEQSKISQKWNPFNKKASYKSVYDKLRRSIAQLESEDFKGIKEVLDSYFSHPDARRTLPHVYSGLKTKAKQEKKLLLDEIKRAVEKIDEILNLNNYPAEQIYANFFTHLNFARNLGENDKINYKIEDNDSKSVFKTKYRIEGNPLDAAAREFYKLLKQWKNPAQDSNIVLWNVYGELMPYLGLILEIRTFISEVLKTNNLLQLSDTSFILKKIIGEDDAPFVYERLGNRIDHYLIDEFQDTSRLQWDIIYPLLSESESKGEDSLIIGDPKQSIYRFRNANHSLITEVVPSAFPDHISAGFSKEDNTNWRSHTIIVRFNNFFFKTLASIISDISVKNGLPTDFNKLYSNVVQYPGNLKNKGYIEVRLLSKPEESDFITDDSNDDNESKDWFEQKSLSQIGPLVSSLKTRGYDLKDIGILVNTNDNGKLVVEALMAYNDSLPDSSPKINFISEESLMISSSMAVQMIISVIEKLSQPASFLKVKDDLNLSPEEKLKQKRYHYISWNKIRVGYQTFSLKHPELKGVQKIMTFLSQPEMDDLIPSLLASLPTPSLVSLVEEVVKNFIDLSLRKADSLYISSFQDLVNNFTASHHDDPATFLEWWHSRGSRTSVAAPEGSEAVQIMTIHKSKGLEFKCVILPFATDSFTPVFIKEEWRWVQTSQHPDLNLPPFLPVKTTTSLLGSEHERYYREYYDQVMTDKLNMAYVAFTRARNELYIFSKKPIKKYNTLSDFLFQILSGKINASTLFAHEELASLISASDINISENTDIFTYGHPLTTEEILEENKKDALKKTKEIHFFNDYYINSSRPRLRAKATTLPPSSNL